MQVAERWVKKFCRMFVSGEGGKACLNCFQNVTQARGVWCKIRTANAFMPESKIETASQKKHSNNNVV